MARAVGSSISTNFRGGSAMAKLAYPGWRLAARTQELGVELDGFVNVADVECELDLDMVTPVVSTSVDASSMDDTLIDVMGGDR